MERTLSTNTYLQPIFELAAWRQHRSCTEKHISAKQMRSFKIWVSIVQTFSDEIYKFR